MIGNPRQDFRAEPHLLSLERKEYYTGQGSLCQQGIPHFPENFQDLPLRSAGGRRSKNSLHPGAGGDRI